jgi:predicted nucleic acid-binding protein
VAGVIVLDASVLIALFDENDAQHTSAVERATDAADEPFGCSPMTLAEVYVGPARARRLEVAQRAIEGLGVTEIGLPTDAATRLASLRAATGLKLPDCCVLLAAQDERAVVLTFDDRLARVAGQLGLTG